ncbi:MAG: DUF5752 family protein [Nanoarchaeota archaeon]|nr:DUF5752 family protein [Nanoarchaeota archaeon]
MSEELSNILRDVRSENCFWINNGPIIHNLYELGNAVEHIDDRTFSYHVNSDKNDFSVWVKSMLKDDVLADDLLSTTDKKTTLSKIRKRISFIERKIEKQKIKELFSKKEHTEEDNGSVHKLKKILLEHTFERVFVELIISFVLGILVGIAAGILIEHYGFIPSSWF